MDVFAHYLAGMEDPEQKARFSEVLDWIAKTYPDLDKRIAWNQPMFTHHGTFIIGFSAAKAHMAVAPERAGIDQFVAELVEAGYHYTAEIFRIKWSTDVDFTLLGRIIEYNMEDKAGCTTFWRK
ncbi:MAG: iron chaperone [Limnochordia bacterium]|jgi:uncharacterized protein YdhG (YjbR/CyaY superfamily)|nr:iron chaperone [Limnochordia bacterium]